MDLQDISKTLRSIADLVDETVETNKKVATLERALACAQLEISELKIAQMDCMAKNSELEQRVAELESFSIEPEARTTETIEITEVINNDQTNSFQQIPNSNQPEMDECDQDCGSSIPSQDPQSGADTEASSGASNTLEFLPDEDTATSLGSHDHQTTIDFIREQREGADRDQQQFEDATRELFSTIGEIIGATQNPGTTIEVQATELSTSPEIATTNRPVLRGATSSVSVLDDPFADKQPAKPSRPRQPKRASVKRNKKRRKTKGFGAK